MVKTRYPNKMAWHRLIFQQILMFGWPPLPGGHFCFLPKSHPQRQSFSCRAVPQGWHRSTAWHSAGCTTGRIPFQNLPSQDMERPPLTPQYMPSCKPVRRIPKQKDAAGGFGSIDSDVVHDLPGHGPPATAHPCLCIRQWKQQRPENHHESRRQAMSTSPPKPFAAQNLPKSEKISNFEANLR